MEVGRVLVDEHVVSLWKLGTIQHELRSSAMCGSYISWWRLQAVQPVSRKELELGDLNGIMNDPAWPDLYGMHHAVPVRSGAVECGYSSYFLFHF